MAAHFRSLVFTHIPSNSHLNPFFSRFKLNTQIQYAYIYTYIYIYIYTYLQLPKPTFFGVAIKTSFFFKIHVFCSKAFGYGK